MFNNIACNSIVNSGNTNSSIRNKNATMTNSIKRKKSAKKKFGSIKYKTAAAIMTTIPSIVLTNPDNVSKELIAGRVPVNGAGVGVESGFIQGVLSKGVQDVTGTVSDLRSLNLEQEREKEKETKRDKDKDKEKDKDTISTKFTTSFNSKSFSFKNKYKTWSHQDHASPMSRHCVTVYPVERDRGSVTCIKFRKSKSMTGLLSEKDGVISYFGGWVVFFEISRAEIFARC